MAKFSSKCSIGRREKTYSIIIYTLIIAVIIAAVALPALRDTPDDYKIHLLIINLFLIIAFAIPVFLMPRAISIDGTNITIKRFFSEKKIPISAIVAVSPKEKMEFMGDQRHFGLSGVLGYYGLFKNKAFGEYTAIVNNSNTMFWVISGDKIRLLNCDERDKAVKLITQMLKTQRNN